MKRDAYMQMFSESVLSGGGTCEDVTARLADHLSDHFDELSPTDVAVLVQVGGQLVRNSLEIQWSGQSDSNPRGMPTRLISAAVALVRATGGRTQAERPGLTQETAARMFCRCDTAIPIVLDAANDPCDERSHNVGGYPISQLRPISPSTVEPTLFPSLCDVSDQRFLSDRPAESSSSVWESSVDFSRTFEAMEGEIARSRNIRSQSTRLIEKSRLLKNSIFLAVGKHPQH